MDPLDNPENHPLIDEANIRWYTKLLKVRNDRKRECVFCKKIRQDSGSNRLLFEDEHYVAFFDHLPAARVHILVVPKPHLEELSNLNPPEELTRVVRDMLEIGKRLIGDDASTTRFGFHAFPFISVFHLHLHCIKLPFILKRDWKFDGKCEKLGGFVTAESLLSNPPRPRLKRTMSLPFPGINALLSDPPPPPPLNRSMSLPPPCINTLLQELDNALEDSSSLKGAKGRWRRRFFYFRDGLRRLGEHAFKLGHKCVRLVCSAAGNVVCGHGTDLSPLGADFALGPSLPMKEAKSL